MSILDNLDIKEKVKLFNELYSELSGYGVNGDTQLAHVNDEEIELLKNHGGSGTINPKTGLPQYFGGGGGGGGGGVETQTQIVREAPGVEERKLELMDLARDLIDKPQAIPAQQVAQLSGLEQQAIRQAGTTGVGQTAVQSGIASALSAAGTPNISQFMNPYQRFVTDEITRQANIRQNEVAADAVRSGAFGGARQGVEAAEIERARQANIGQALGSGFEQALGAAQNQQRMQLGAGELLGGLGQQQQAMSQQDLAQLTQAGGLQRQLAQLTMDAQRQSQLQQQFEPFQRLEFAKNIYAAGPTSQSQITLASAPQTSPLAQSIGTGLGAFAAYKGAFG
mgnify:CR=1 FL=1|tara:strand:+ start:1030 stop:2043 length:1014 start_codon:yes stop_codon:yes gene_type:complete